MGRVVVIASVNVDHVVRVRALPAAGETVLALGAADGFGGKGANQAWAAAAAGAAVEVVAAVGDDAAGAAARADLRSAGIGCERVVVVTAATGRATVLVDAAGENAIVVERGANALLAASHVAAALEALALGPGDVLLGGGEVDPACAATAARIAVARGALVVHNLAPYTDWDAWLDDVRPVVVLNAVEAAQATGGTDVEAAVAALGERLPGVIVTVGAAGAVLIEDGRRTTIAAPPVQVVDTTGAGDAFCGTLAAGLAAGDPLGTATRAAVAAAARAVTHAGARPSVVGPS